MSKIWHRLARQKLACLGFILATSWMLAGMLAPELAPYDPLEQAFSQRYQTPS
jgi:ABC-type antimicrobial peptide transport system permease subunit